MKRPNIRRMQKYRARSTPDVVRKVFNYDHSRFVDELPGVREFMDKFRRDMELKHGTKNFKVDTTILDRMTRYPDEFVLELKYLDPFKSSYDEWHKGFDMGVMTRNEIAARIMWNGG